jgi:hypothetical protein
MTRGWVHTVPRDGNWVNEIEDGEVLGGHDRKEDAVAAGRDEAIRRQTEHVIHNADGTIAERNSYGSDPTSSPG